MIGSYDQLLKLRIARDIAARSGDHAEALIQNDRIRDLSSVECPHCHWGFAPSVITQHIREKH